MNMMNDVILRQDAIDALGEEPYLWEDNDEFTIGQRNQWNCDVDALKVVPSLEQRIITCKDCKHFVRYDVEEYTPYGFYNTYFHAFCDKHFDKEKGEYIDVNMDDFCSFAEKRID